MESKRNSYAKPPCKNCSDRCVGCHGTCNDYKTFKEEIEQVRKAAEKNKEIDDYIKHRNAKIKQHKMK